MTDRSRHDVGSGDLVVCMTVVHVSQPFDSGQSVEVKLRFAPCHGVKAGSHMQLIIDADMVNLYKLGDQHSIHMRLM